MEGKTGAPGEKAVGAEETTDEIDPLVTLSPEIDLGAYWWNVSGFKDGAY